MNIRVLFAITIMSIATVVQARSPFGRGSIIRNYARSTVQPKPTNHASSVRGLPNSPEEMTKRFGRSILVRQESIGKDASTFVTQPKY